MNSTELIAKIDAYLAETSGGRSLIAIEELQDLLLDIRSGLMTVAG